MRNLKKKIMIVVPIVLTIGSVSATLAFSISNNVGGNNSSNDDSWTDSDIYDKLEIFPELKQREFYNHIRIEYGKAIINDEMIANIAWHILKASKITNGDLYWNYEHKNEQELTFSFKWISPIGKEYSKTYEFKLSQDYE